MHSIAKGQQRTQNDNKPFRMTLWTNPEEEGQNSRSGAMRFASRLFRRNFLFALLYTLVSSEQMIRSLWDDLNSSWLSVWAFFTSCDFRRRSQPCIDLERMTLILRWSLGWWCKADLKEEEEKMLLTMTKMQMLLRLASTSGGISSTDDTALDEMSLNALAESLAQNCGNVF